jgi:hypothetical protein
MIGIQGRACGSWTTLPNSASVSFARMPHARRFDCRHLTDPGSRVSGLRLADFVIGTVYDVRAADAIYPLTLDKGQELSDSGREGGSFRLEFLGPADPVLPQAIYRFAGGRADHDIFIVPIARNPDGVRYEAIFY